MKRLACWLGRHDYYYEIDTLNGERQKLQFCENCTRVWRRVRFDMHIYWERIR